MEYSKKTIDAIKDAYPLRTDLHELAESGDSTLVRILDEFTDDIITAIDICNAFESVKKEELRNLYERARAHVKKCRCHDMAMEDFYNSFSPDNNEKTN